MKLKYNKFITGWAYKEGVFKIKKGRYIVRVRSGKCKTFTTISQHNKEEDAKKAYDSFYNSLCIVKNTYIS